MNGKHWKNAARVAAIQFLYQSEANKLFYFSASHFETFCHYFGVPTQVAEASATLCQGIFQRCDKIDQQINAVSPKWPVTRMVSLDRCVLRLAVFELLASEEPVKVILNEAIDLAKLYGTEHSGKFVNGVLDTLAKQLRVQRE